MGVVSMVGNRKGSDAEMSEVPSGNNDNNVVPFRIKHVTQVPNSRVHRQLRSMLESYGIDFTDPKCNSDLRLISFVVDGLMNSVKGPDAAKLAMHECIRELFIAAVPVDYEGTQAEFGDILKRFDEA